jgi:hypothetical protein
VQCFTNSRQNAVDFGMVSTRDVPSDYWVPP